jgi:SSS family solute:Na+ symporter
MQAEQVFPYFIMTRIPPGLTGLILAALISAAMSSLDSDLNCLAAVGVEDYYRRFNPQSTDQQCLVLGRVIVILSGLLAIGVACLYVLFEGKGVLGIVFTLYSIFSGGIAGLFILAFFCPRANKQGLYVGIIACVLFTAYALLTTNTYRILGWELHWELGRFNFPHHKYMIGVYSHLVLLGVGYVSSLFFGSERPPKNLTVYGWLQRRRSQSQ